MELVRPHAIASPGATKFTTVVLEVEKLVLEIEFSNFATVLKIFFFAIFAVQVEFSPICLFCRLNAAVEKLSLHGHQNC